MSAQAAKRCPITGTCACAMAERGMYVTSDLLPLLAERGVVLSREQVYRLVAEVPKRSAC